MVVIQRREILFIKYEVIHKTVCVQLKKIL